MTDVLRGGHSTADVFDQAQRVYACAATVGVGKPHLRRLGNTWGVVHPLSGWSPVPGRQDWRAAAYAWCWSQSAMLVTACGQCGGAVRVRP